MRTCNKCKKEYPLTAQHWHRHKQTAGGFRRTCKYCINRTRQEERAIQKANTQKPTIRRYEKATKLYPLLSDNHLTIRDIENYSFKIGQRYKVTESKRKIKTSIVGECVENFKTYILLQLADRTETVLKIDVLIGNYEVEDVS